MAKFHFHNRTLKSQVVFHHDIYFQNLFKERSAAFIILITLITYLYNGNLHLYNKMIQLSNRCRQMNVQGGKS